MCPIGNIKKNATVDYILFIKKCVLGIKSNFLSLYLHPGKRFMAERYHYWPCGLQDYLTLWIGRVPKGIEVLAVFIYIFFPF